MSPCILKAIGSLAVAPNKVISFFGQALIAILRGGIRFEHSRRSRLLEFSSAGAWFECSAGKARKDGKPPPPPYKFFVPEVSEGRGPFPVGCVQKYCERLKRLYQGEASWMQSALWPRSASVFSAKQLRRSPMALGAFSSQLFQLWRWVPPRALRSRNRPRQPRTPLGGLALRLLRPAISCGMGVPLWEMECLRPC